jgi:UDP-N-acetylmuramate dehydrogenase
MVELEEQQNQDQGTRDSAVKSIASQLNVRAEAGLRFAELTSLRVGGAIDWVLSPRTEDQAAALIHKLEEHEIAWRPLGSGSNVLADDGEHHYVIVSLKDLKADPAFDGRRVSVSAGYSLPRLCIDAARQGLSGIEGLNGIPGTVGGALWMNAGAYGQEIGTVVETVRVARGGKVHHIPGSEIQWNYRHTSFREGELLLGATLLLQPDDKDEIAAPAAAGCMVTQLHGARSAGCFFKNAPTVPWVPAPDR